MNCRHCGRETYVKTTEPDTGSVVRIRVCGGCKCRYRTEERITEEMQLAKKKDPTPDERRAERERWHAHRTNK